MSSDNSSSTDSRCIPAGESSNHSVEDSPRQPAPVIRDAGDDVKSNFSIMLPFGQAQITYEFSLTPAETKKVQQSIHNLFNKYTKF